MRFQHETFTNIQITTEGSARTSGSAVCMSALYLCEQKWDIKTFELARWTQGLRSHDWGQDSATFGAFSGWKVD